MVPDASNAPPPIDYGAGGERPLDGIAATVVLLRDGDTGLEVLLLQRPERGSFPGAWVFPGGVVEPVDRVGGDGDDAAASRLAGARETHEETGLVLDPDDLVHLSTWHPPQHSGRRYLTTFYVARAPQSQITPAPDEVVDHRWLPPATALELHREEQLLLIPPTWVTLHSFTGDATVDAALSRYAEREPRQFSTRATADMAVLLWDGDVAYDDESLLLTEGGRHRLEVSRRPWVYTQSTP